jgi:hypothetical protein
MTSWIVRELAHDVEAVSLIERRGLERVRVERDLRTTMASCFFLDRSEQPTSDTATPHILAHPERLDPACSAPAPAVDPAISSPSSSVSAMSISWNSAIPPL